MMKNKMILSRLSKRKRGKRERGFVCAQSMKSNQCKATPVNPMQCSSNQSMNRSIQINQWTNERTSERSTERNENAVRQLDKEEEKGEKTCSLALPFTLRETAVVAAQEEKTKQESCHGHLGEGPEIIHENTGVSWAWYCTGVVWYGMVPDSYTNSQLTIPLNLFILCCLD